MVAEIGINHQGDERTAIELVRAASKANADAVKFQVGDPRLYVREERWQDPRDTPWGSMPYIEYRERMELSQDALRRAKQEAERLGMEWFASPLDTSAVARLEALDVPHYKIASPMLTDALLLGLIDNTGRPVIFSSGMTSPAQLQAAVAMVAEPQRAAVLHCTSVYPCPPELCNLRVIKSLGELFPNIPVGYSGHEEDITESIAAVALGARVVERHLTLSRAMWGSDHAASLEPRRFAEMVERIRTVELALGDGVKEVYEQESKNAKKFRK